MSMIILVLILVLPLLFIGVINKFKAKFAGKQGASIFQQYYDFAKLIKKGQVISNVTSFVFQIAPTINLACVIIATILLICTDFSGNFIMFAYLLGLGKFFNVIAAMDTGSSFEGMGAAREVSYTSFVENAFFIVIGSLAAFSHIYTFDALFETLHLNNEIGVLIHLLIICMLFMMIIIEGSRIPVDDPKTHLELTMIHEVMILDNSGVDLAFIHYTNALKMLLFTALISFMIFGTSVLGFLLTFLVIAFLIACVEAFGARIRLTHIIEYSYTMMCIALTVMALILLSIYGGLK